MCLRYLLEKALDQKNFTCGWADAYGIMSALQVFVLSSFGPYRTFTWGSYPVRTYHSKVLAVEAGSLVGDGRPNVACAGA